MLRKKILIIIIFSALFTTFSFYFYQIINAPNILVNKPSKNLSIPYNTTFKNLQAILHKNEFVQDIVTFSFLARLMQYDRKILPGCYALKKNMSNLEAIRLLRSGQQQPVNITFHNIRTIEELCNKITNSLSIDKEKLLHLLLDTSFVQKFGFTTDNIKAMFVPNTYQVYWTISAPHLFTRMHKEYQKFWTKSRKIQASKLGLTPIEVTILASIVQEETTHIQEMSMIAGVFLNRLKKGMPLQACPTVRYALQNFSIKRILNKHTKIASPYNTYLKKGLPPGPINVPSIAAIDAVLKAKKHAYLFFVAKSDLLGLSYFSKTLQEHLVSARRYHKMLNRAKIY